MLNPPMTIAMKILREDEMNRASNFATAHTLGPQRTSHLKAYRREAGIAKICHELSKEGFRQIRHPGPPDSTLSLSEAP